MRIVRGGAEAASYFEWGGNNASGTYEFDTKRPGWEAPIHQLFKDNGVSAYFHGHDHQYVYETRDGIVYQEVPQPGHAGEGASRSASVGGLGGRDDQERDGKKGQGETSEFHGVFRAGEKNKN